MKIISSSKFMNSVSRRLIKSGKRIGFVPTMGALHEGHLSLIEKAKKENDVVAVSIFINPKQFSKGEDYKQYPRDIKSDRLKAAKAGCDILFYPNKDSIYKNDFSTYVEVKGLSDIMCGASRPGHFRGVATICLKLFNITMAHSAYFGQKDYQQVVIIKKMVNDLDVNIDIRMLPTVRKPSGLAMSSRNSYLSQKEYNLAGLIYSTLKNAKRLITAGERRSLKIISGISATLKENGIAIDYIAIADPITLQSLKHIEGKALIALAARIGKTRLIDNIVVIQRGNRCSG
jgi:pantoate--beta-alanine ligase